MKISVIFSILFFSTSVFSQDYKCRIKTIFPPPDGNVFREGRWEVWRGEGDVYSVTGSKGKYLIMYEDQDRIRLERSTGAGIITVFINKKKLEMTSTLTMDGYVMVSEGKCELSE